MKNHQGTHPTSSSGSPQFEQPPEARIKGRLIQRIKDRLLRPPFSDDIFISYSRSDGPTYAAGLATKLAGQEFSCRFDQWGTKPGAKIPKELRRALRRSALFVLVGTPGAATSEHVADEVVEFKRTGRDIIPVIFEGVSLKNGSYLGGAFTEGRKPAANAVAPQANKALWADEIFGAPIFLEQKDALINGNPADELLNRIKKNFAFKRKDERLRKAARLLGGVLALLTVVLAVAAYFASVKAGEATEAIAKAEKFAREASAQQDLVVAKTREAEDAEKRAEAAKKTASDQEEIAAQERIRAETQTLVANAATKRANEQTRVAKAAERSAVIAKIKADAEEFKAQSARARNYFNQAQTETANDPMRALVWAQKALETAPPKDERLGIYKLRALQLTRKAPRTIVSTGAAVQGIVYSQKQDKAITTTATGNRGYQVWDLTTGKMLPDPFARCNCEYKPATDVANPAFSLDGRWAVLMYYKLGRRTTGRDPLRLLVWETATGKEQFDVVTPELDSLRVSESQGIIFRRALAFSPDGKSILLGGRVVWQQKECGDEGGGELLVFERATGSLLKTIPTCESPPNALHVSDSDFPLMSQNPQRNWMLTFTGNKANKVIQVTDASTGNVLKLLRPDKPLQKIAFSRDADHVFFVTGNDRGDSSWEARVWDIFSENLSRPISLRGIRVLDASRDGSKLLIAIEDNKKLRIVPVKENNSTSDDIILAKTDEFLYAKLADDEKHVVTMIPNRTAQALEINVLETSSGANIIPPIMVRQDEEVFRVSCSAMTLTRLERSSGVISVHHFKQKGAENLLPTEHLPLPKGREFFEAFFTPDGEGVVTIETKVNDPLGPTGMQLWDLKTAQPVWKSKVVTVYPPDSCSFSPDGSRFVSDVVERSEDGRLLSVIRMRSKSTGELMPGFRSILGRYESVVFNRDGAQLVTIAENEEGAESRRWDSLTGEPLGASIPVTAANMTIRTLTRHGEFLVLVAKGSDVLADPKKFVVRSLKPGDERQLSFNFTTHEGAALAVAILKQAREITFAKGHSLSANFGSELSIILTAQESGATISYREAGLEFLAPFKGIRSFQNIELSPDGKLLATRGEQTFGKLLRIWETKTGQPISEELFHEETVAEFRFIADGERLVTVANDGRVRSWYIGSARDDRPDWMSHIGEALAGMKLESDAEMARIKQDDYARLRSEYAERLRQAAAGGDKSALFVLDNWRP